MEASAVRAFGGGRELNSEVTENEFRFLRFREGIDAFREGVQGWGESAPDEFPTFDLDILPEGRATWEGNETVRGSSSPATAALELTNALPPVETRLRDRYFAVVSEGADGLLEPFLAEHAGLVELAQELADSLDGRAPHLEELGPAADAFRLLLMDLFAKFRAGEEAAALGSFERCGRLLRAFEAKPSILALFSVTSLRTGWHAALQRLVAEDALTVPTKEGLAQRLTLFGFDPRFPVECVRHNYADQRDLLADSLLGGSWEEVAPAGKRLFVRALEPNLGWTRLLAEAMEPETSPDRSDAILASLPGHDGLHDAFLAARPLMVELCYGARELKEEDGKAYGEAVDECVVATLVGLGQLRLGPLGSTLHELREEERRILESLRDPHGLR